MYYIMTIINKYIILGLLIGLLILIFSNYCFLQNRHENFENIKIDIGNYLSTYFCELGLSILQKTDFNYNNDTNIEMIKYLPNHLPYIYDNFHDELVKHNVTYEYINLQEKVALWFIDDNRKFHFWKILKPLFNAILDKALIQSNLKVDINTPIIHFRCSDTPFVLHRYYHFAKYEFYKNALQIIQKQTNNIFDKIIVLSCNFHLSNTTNVEKCTDYSNMLCNYLNSIGYKTEQQCNSNINDFANMFYAPAVISIGSSFSFISGFCGNGIFISSEHEEETDIKYKCNICDDIMIPGKIKHKDVVDYYDTSTVNKLLYEIITQ